MEGGTGLGRSYLFLFVDTVAEPHGPPDSLKPRHD